MKDEEKKISTPSTPRSTKVHEEKYEKQKGNSLLGFRNSGPGNQVFVKRNS
jgi:hypothetical protein